MSTKGLRDLFQSDAGDEVAEDPVYDSGLVRHDLALAHCHDSSVDRLDAPPGPVKTIPWAEVRRRLAAR
jgi:hypothetical protein